MSGITTIVVKEGEYACEECLQSTLNELGLIRQIKLSLSENGMYQISMSQKVQDYQGQEVQKELHQKLKEFHELILPKYTEFHAVHTFKQKGYSYVKTLKTAKGYKYIFEKVIGEGGNQHLERYEIEVIPSENRILIDGGDMPGRKCRDQAKKFEKDMGSFHSFVPRQTTQENQQVKQYTQSTVSQKRR